MSSLFIIGIAGASGSGKTHFANIIREQMEDPSDMEIISCDSYYKPYPGGGVAPADFNWDSPDVIDLELLKHDINRLRQGLCVAVPDYDFKTNQRAAEPHKTIDGSKLKVILVEGLFVLLDKELCSLYNLKIFTWLDLDICLARRLIRDFKERGSSYEKTLHVYQKNVKPAYVNFIEPTKKNADLIISTSEYTDSVVSLDVIKMYISAKLLVQKLA